MLIWSGIVLLGVLSRRDARPPLWNLAKAIMQPLIIGTLLALAAWVIGLALVAEQFGVWEIRLINETVWWFLATGVVLWFSLPRVATEQQFFRKALQRVVTFSLLGEAFINLVVFPLGVEFFLVPFLTVLIALEAFTRGQDEYAGAQKLCEWVSALIGLALFAYVAIHLIGDPSQIDLVYIARLIALPAWLTLLSLPLVFLVGMWFAYQGVFHMIGFWAADKRAARWAKLLLLRHLNVRPTCASLLFENGKNVKQVSEWLGHSDPSFTLSTYIHLLDDGIGGADFFDEALGGNKKATDGPEKAANQSAPDLAESAN